MSRLLRRLSVLLFIILSGALATIRGGAASYLLFEFSLLLPCLSFAYLVYVYFNFQIYQNLHTHTMVKGQRIPYSFVLSNFNHITYCDVRITFENKVSNIEEISPDKSYCLLPGTRINKRTYLSCKYRGKYRVGIDRIVITDYLNLFSLSYSCSGAVYVTVLPKVVKLQRLTFVSYDEREPQEELSLRDEIPNMQLRPYINGDSMHRIHWQASAKNQELFTRQFTEEPRSRQLIILDLRKMYPNNDELRLAYEDKLLECTLAIVDFFLQNRTSVTVAYSSGSYKNFLIDDDVTFNNFYRFCAEVSFCSDKSAAVLLGCVNHSSTQPCNVLIVTGQIDEELLTACMTGENRVNNTAIYYVGDHPADDASLSFSQIFISQDTKEALEG